MIMATAVVAVVVVVQVVVPCVPIKVVGCKLGVIMRRKQTYKLAKAALEDACTEDDGCESGHCSNYKCKVKCSMNYTSNANEYCDSSTCTAKISNGATYTSSDHHACQAFVTMTT